MKTSEKSIIRIKDLKEQPESRFILLPAGLDRVLIACDYYDINDGILTAYGPRGPEEDPLFSCPVASGYVIVRRDLTSVETLLEMMVRMHADEREAHTVHAQLEEAAEKPRPIDTAPVIDMAAFKASRDPGQYL